MKEKDRRGLALIGAAARLALALALGALFTKTMDPLMGSLGRIWQLLGLACGALLLMDSWMALKNQKGSFLTEAGISLFCVVGLLGWYRVWCREPQFWSYGREVLALCSGALFAYYRAAWKVGLGKALSMARWRLAMVILWALAALAGGQIWWLYLAGGLWALGCGSPRDANKEGEHGPS